MNLKTKKIKAIIYFYTVPNNEKNLYNYFCYLEISVLITRK